MKRGLIAALAIGRKDLRTELRTKESLNGSTSFALVVLVLFSFAFDLGREEIYAISGGILWLVYAFAGALIVNRSYTREVPNDCLDVVVASAAPGWSVFLGKATASFFLLLFVELVSLPLFGLFFSITWTPVFWRLLLVMVLTTWGITTVGSAFSAVTVNVRLRELMLPVLSYPLLIPLLISAMQMTTAMLSGDAPSGTDNDAIRLMVVFDIIYTSLSLYLIETILIV